MQIVTDSGYDLSPQQKEGLPIHSLPLKLTLNSVSYRSGIDIQPEEFYAMLEKTDAMPTTSTPSPGEFLELYQKIAETDTDILSVHISSGLSSTLSVAQVAASQLPHLNIQLVDTRTLSGEMGWQVEAAGRGALEGWSLEAVLQRLAQIRAASEIVFTLPNLSYLIHGGRISHLKGLLANLLGIKPLIGVDKTDGKYYDRGKARTFQRAIQAIPAYIASKFPEGTHLRAQVGHANNPDAANKLREATEALFECDWLPDFSISPVLGAHTGRGLVGLVFAPLSSLPA
ncbi:MAG TPA: DegV family protein [Brevefilum sp.]|nr:DegV family protein [Candidatus Cloacimonadota bacterium]HOE70733.1 DegV family protein [Brevefilum sp.]HOR18930.1 DegV family protein [Brevefilum sp.]HPL69391.1 DegV family protein [Brevefilum sp.]